MSPKVSVLVVDTNRVFAKSVKEILEKNLADGVADVATNIWEVRRRLQEKTYDLVLADTSVALDGKEMLREFKKSNVTVVQWSAIQVPENGSLRKPFSTAQLTDIVHSLPLPA